MIEKNKKEDFLMGLIKAALGAAGGVLADQWKDYFYCEAISADGNAPAARRRPESSARSAENPSPPTATAGPAPAAR